jgi:hypothetical protein
MADPAVQPRGHWTFMSSKRERMSIKIADHDREHVLNFFERDIECWRYLIEQCQIPHQIARFHGHRAMARSLL